MRVYIYILPRTHASIHAHICMCTHIHAHRHPYTHVYMHWCVCIFAHCIIRMHICTHMLCIRMHIPRYTHVLMDVCIWMLMQHKHECISTYLFYVHKCVGVRVSWDCMYAHSSIHSYAMFVFVCTFVYTHDECTSNIINIANMMVHNAKIYVCIVYAMKSFIALSFMKT
jgi:hypothetical protein